MTYVHRVLYLMLELAVRGGGSAVTLPTVYDCPSTKLRSVS